MALYYENALSFTCGCGYQKEQLVSYCEVVEEGLSENGGKVVTGGIDGMWLLFYIREKSKIRHLKKLSWGLL